MINKVFGCGEGEIEQQNKHIDHYCHLLQHTVSYCHYNKKKHLDVEYSAQDAFQE
jgi:hypothetical protein